jgi:hypothetical protein
VQPVAASATSRANAVRTAAKDAEDFSFQFSFHKPV